jgi:hypothetical protein
MRKRYLSSGNISDTIISDIGDVNGSEYVNFETPDYTTTIAYAHTKNMSINPNNFKVKKYNVNILPYAYLNYLHEYTMPLFTKNLNDLKHIRFYHIDKIDNKNNIKKDQKIKKLYEFKNEKLYYLAENSNLYTYDDDNNLVLAYYNHKQMIWNRMQRHTLK